MLRAQVVLDTGLLFFDGKQKSRCAVICSVSQIAGAGGWRRGEVRDRGILSRAPSQISNVKSGLQDALCGVSIQSYRHRHIVLSRCHNSERGSSIWAASSIPRSFATTPSARCSSRMSQKGTRFPSSSALPIPTQRKVSADAFCYHRQALRYIIRNNSLPQRTRAQAQLQLTQMHPYTQPTKIRNRCAMGGKARGTMSDFRMSRVSTDTSNPSPRLWAASSANMC